MQEIQPDQTQEQSQKSAIDYAQDIINMFILADPLVSPAIAINAAADAVCKLAYLCGMPPEDFDKMTEDMQEFHKEIKQMLEVKKD